MPLRSDLLVPSRNPLPELAGLRLHVLGVRGGGMGPLARAAVRAGADVDGCDPLPGDDDAALHAAGIAIANAHDPSHLEGNRHLVVTTAASPDLPEVRAAAVDGRLHHRTELLAALVSGRETLAVTGSHGKGTVAALAACALAELDRDPLVLLGVEARCLGGPFRGGDGPAVVEADDADGTIVRIPSTVTVVTNSWSDHPSWGRTRTEVLEDVAEHVAAVPASGRVLLGRGRNLSPLARRALAPVWRLGRDLEVETVTVTRDARVVRIHDPDGSVLTGRVRIHGGGVADNVALAYGALRAMGVASADAAVALESLDSLRRRCDLVGEAEGVLVFDDLGKHPAAIAATLEALRELCPRRLHVAFEPHLDFDVLHWGRRWVEALSVADTAIVLPLDSRTYFPVPRVAPSDWPARAGSSAEVAASRVDAIERLARRSRPGDAVVVCGMHTNLTEVARGVLERIRSRERGTTSARASAAS